MLIGERIKAAAEKVGGLDRLAQITSVKRRTMYDYASGKTEPKISTVVDIARATGTAIEWLAIGEGEPSKKIEIEINGVSLETVQKYTWNIAATFWEKIPRRTTPEEFADEFIETLNYLLTHENVNEDAASAVIQFGAERQKRTSGRGA